jgi:hypothetical protein
MIIQQKLNQTKPNQYELLTSITIQAVPYPPLLVALKHNNTSLAKRLLELENGVINFSGCNLEKLPSEIFTWIEAGLVKELNISENMFQSLPIELRHVKKVNAAQNPLQTIPVDIRRGKWLKMKQYLDKIANKAQSWDVRKLLLVGEEGVGKSVKSIS